MKILDPDTNLNQNLTDCFMSKTLSKDFVKS